LRGIGHLFLAAYFMVPLMILVILRVYSGEIKISIRSYKTIGSIVICLLTSSAGVYYAVFACFFLLVAGTSASLK
jgi:hypothetical protein